MGRCVAESEGEMLSIDIGTLRPTTPQCKSSNPLRSFSLTAVAV